ncbi:hypothetical protein NYE33_33490 [Paenibacillus sp. FSL R10-2199]|uniref:hypothetical protein n=1 Tax=Paenibacillus sp. FSL R10-2199 TaxID=2975348 RepID=UPI0030F62A89
MNTLTSFPFFKKLRMHKKLEKTVFFLVKKLWKKLCYEFLWVVGYSANRSKLAPKEKHARHQIWSSEEEK